MRTKNNTILSGLLFLFSFSHLFAQSGIISGKVVNEKNEPLAYANIILEGTLKGAIANEQGNFVLTKVSNGKHTLKISSIGFESISQVVEVDGSSTLVLEPMQLKESSSQLNTVVISATRSERQLDELPVPITIVSKEQIKNIGSLRLNEVLAEQTGLAIVNDHGIGLQVQGFAPEYTLILVDGEPLIGRTAGTFDLTRVAVGNIKQIEIVKGPSSSLYGSEALAGVVNIITDRVDGFRGNLTSRYGTNGTLDLSGDASCKKEKLGVSAFVNRYSTEGYDLVKETYGNTVDPFSNYTFNTKLSYDFSNKVKFSIAGRYFTEDQQSKTNIGTESQPEILKGTGSQKDYNINPTLSINFSPKLRTIFRFYSTQYKTKSLLTYEADGSDYDQSFFNQNFTRTEIQTEYFINPNNVFTLGVGKIWESVEATRYEEKVAFETNYLYFQYEWKPINKLNLIAGGRYDDHSAYASQFSPKLSAQYEATKWLTVRGSMGVGFKAPDFRQLYLNFTNPVAGYSVFGTQEVARGIAQFQQQGQITEILADPATITSINAESSVAYNLDFILTPVKKLTANINLFRNDVKDLIDTQVIARKTNGQSVFSYVNRDAVFTQGAETDISYSLRRSVNLSVGYQYLIAKDKAVVEQLEKGEVFARDPETLATYRVTEQQYGGLFNRSRHMLNVKFFYQNPTTGWSGSVRTIYRGKYGFGDRNNNTILDAENEYVDGYATINLSVAKSFNNMFCVQAGCDNLFDYTDAEFISALPGRLVWASVALTFSKK
jgi:outer membrane receptor for ferrienterochelin and colicins